MSSADGSEGGAAGWTQPRGEPPSPGAEEAAAAHLSELRLGEERDYSDQQSAEPTEPPGEANSTGAQPPSGEGKHGEAGDSREVGMIDQDLEAEEIEEVVEKVKLMRAAQEAVEDSEAETTIDPKVYEQIAQNVIANLPRGQAVVQPVLKDMLRECEDGMDWLLPFAKKMSNLTGVRNTILTLWAFLLKILREGIDKPSTSKRASTFTLKRHEAHEDQLQAFLADESIFAVARDGFSEKRAVRCLGLFFNLLDQATWHFMTKAISSANLVDVTYPTTQLVLSKDQCQILYFLAGWLLSSALTRVSRDRRLGPVFCPFVDRHKHESAAEFKKAHPELSGLEEEVANRNVKWRGLSLIFADAAFYEFVLALESGYYHSLKNPALLAMYFGDLPKKILEVVSSSVTVRVKFQRCVDSVEVRGEDGQALSNSRRFIGLFHFFMSKWHNMRMSDFAKRLTKVQTIIKEDKKARGALRDQLNTSSNQALRDKVGPGKTKRATKTPPSPTIRQMERRVELAGMIGSHTFSKLRAKDLKEYIKECGGVFQSKSNVRDLRSILKGIAPGIGVDEEPELTEDGVG